MINGIINVYKEKGYTSHDVVAKLRGILKQKKIGHTGTLDPDAVGVLPVCLGKATKLCDLLTDKDKIYEVTLLLGCTTDTEDTTGTVLTSHEVNLTIEQVQKVIFSFIGPYSQIPPMYSALKVNGKKLYELAREGKVIERKARDITIHNIEIKDITLPKVVMTVECSKGTYIRSLCRDIGELLRCGGCMENLTRTKVQGFSIQDSLTLDQIMQLRDKDQLMDIVKSIEDMFPEHTKINVSAEHEKLIYNGNKFSMDHIISEQQSRSYDTVRVYDIAGQFIGIYKYNIEEQLFVPRKLFI